MMDSVSRTARVLKAEEPDFPNTFLMPERQSAQAVLTAARLFARGVEPFAAKFIPHGFANTFLGDFDRLLQTYEQAVTDREAGKGQTAAARASVEAAVASGLAAARKLDVIVANQLGDDPVVVAEWRRNRRVGYRAPKQPPPVAVAPIEPADVTPLEPPAAGPPAEEAAPAISAETSLHDDGELPEAEVAEEDAA